MSSGSLERKAEISSAKNDTLKHSTAQINTIRDSHNLQFTHSAIYTIRDSRNQQFTHSEMRTTVDDDDESPFIHDSIQKLFTPWCMYAYSQPP